MQQVFAQPCRLLVREIPAADFHAVEERVVEEVVVERLHGMKIVADIEPGQAVDALQEMLLGVRRVRLPAAAAAEAAEPSEAEVRIVRVGQANEAELGLGRHEPRRRASRHIRRQNEDKTCS